MLHDVAHVVFTTDFYTGLYEIIIFIIVLACFYPLRAGIF